MYLQIDRQGIAQFSLIVYVLFFVYVYVYFSHARPAIMKALFSVLGLRYWDFNMGCGFNWK